MTIGKSLINAAKIIRDYATAAALIVYTVLTPQDSLLSGGFCDRTYDPQGNLTTQVQSSPFSPDVTVSTRQSNGKNTTHKDTKRPNLTWRIASPSLAPKGGFPAHFNTLETR